VSAFRPKHVVENLGHSAAAYKAAKTHLVCKYGEKPRARWMQEFHSFKPIRKENEKDLEGFAEWAISELSCTSFSKRGPVQNLSYENKFYMHVNENSF